MGVLDKIKWFGHASFSLENSNKNFYFVDPFDLKSKPKEEADAVFITHAHYDHWSPKDIEKTLGKETIVVLVNGCETALPVSTVKIIKTEPFREINVGGIKVLTVPAYNTKPERKNFHPKENKWVGYIFELDNARIYHAGDTDFIPEMKELGNLDVAMLPIGGTYTMDVSEAIEAANVIKSKITVPMHYRRLLGVKAKDAEEKFVSSVKGRVEILEEVSL